ncbi:MAG: fluoride efflux transporter CrcB [Actinomycetales bacterium]|nr:fluoride efflux transporter CrcB [Actinomycetales bacterium]
MTAVLAVLVGGALGAPLRFLVDRYITSLTASTRGIGELPWGLLVVNSLGSAVAGVVVVATAGELRTLLLVGLCGAFTTFSGFAWEAHRMWSVWRTQFWIGVVAMGVITVGVFLVSYRVTTLLLGTPLSPG